MIRKTPNHKYSILVSSSKCNCVHQTHIKLNWSFASKIFCIHYLPYKERFDDILHTLKQLNINNQPQFDFYYTTNNPFYKNILFSYDQHIDNKSINANNINYTIDSLNLLLLCMHFKYEKVLIIEDDVECVVSLDKLSEYITDIPLQYDVVNFDYLNCSNMNLASLVSINEHYYDCSTISRLFNTSCILLSANAIQHIVLNDAHLLKPFDHYTSFCNTYDDVNIKRCISKKPLFRQRKYHACQSTMMKLYV